MAHCVPIWAPFITTTRQPVPPSGSRVRHTYFWCTNGTRARPKVIPANARHFVGCPSKHRHGTNLFTVISRNRPILVAFYDTHGDTELRLRTHSRLNPPGLGYCFTPYQRLWLYNGAPLVAFYDTLGTQRTYSRLKPPASTPHGGNPPGEINAK